jgi:light-independent protochlorophyllide reductase subunit B
MKLAYWMYAGPAHIGTLRVACSFKNVHAIMHAPLGDDYFNVMRSMLERERDFTPVTTSLVDRHVLAKGSQQKVIDNIIRKNKEDLPDLILLTPTCTSSILQEDLEIFVEQVYSELMGNILLADVNHYRINELQAADKTLEQISRYFLNKNSSKLFKSVKKTKFPSVNIIGIFSLGFHHLHDCRELKRLLWELGISINLIIPEGCFVKTIKDLPKAWINIVPYREIGLMTAVFLEKEYNMPYIDIIPMGLLNIATFIRKLQTLIHEIDPAYNINAEKFIENQTNYISQSAWFSRSIDCQNLRGKKALVFGDASHSAAMTKLLVREMGIQVCCAGTYCKQDADWFREEVQDLCNEILITENNVEICDAITRLEPAAIFGTQMERHIGKKLDIPCGVISAPVHIQNFPLSFRPFLGFEGTNQIADLVYNTFTLGMEDHLLEIFGGHDTNKNILNMESEILWDKESLIELQKIPGFVRGKVKRNTEKYAFENNIKEISLVTLFKAKEHLEN